MFKSFGKFSFLKLSVRFSFLCWCLKRNSRRVLTTPIIYNYFWRRKINFFNFMQLPLNAKNSPCAYVMQSIWIMKKHLIILFSTCSNCYMLYIHALIENETTEFSVFFSMWFNLIVQWISFMPSNAHQIFLFFLVFLKRFLFTSTSKCPICSF